MPEAITKIKVTQIAADKNQIRLGIDDEELNDLARSISRVGLINPIRVIAQDGAYIVIAGHRRFAAVQRLGRAEVDCIVQEADEPAIKETALAENIFRADLSAVETASAMRDMRDSGVMDTPELARAMHRSEHWVNAQLELLFWPADVLELVHSGALSVSAASNLSLVTDDVYREFLCRNAEDNGATARTTAAWLQAWRACLPPSSAVEQEPAAAGTAVTPAIPQAPCLCCARVFRTDGLAHVMLCPECIADIRTGAGS